MIDALPANQPFENIGNFIDTLGWRQHRDMLSNNLIRRVSKDPLGAVIPALNDAVQILTEDGVIGGFNNRGQPLTQFRCLFLLADVQRNATRMDESSSLAIDTGVDRYVTHGPVFAPQPRLVAL